MFSRAVRWPARRRFSTASARWASRPTAWRSMLAATLVVAEAAMAVWAVLALPIVWALGVLGAGLGIGMLAVSQGRLAAFFYLKPALDVVALASAAALWGLFNPL